MYNWFAVETGKLAPDGWHVPSATEWDVLALNLGGEAVAGGKMKEPGNAHWSPDNVDATNSSGFTALPGGHRSNFGSFLNHFIQGAWWESTGDANYPPFRFCNGSSGSLSYYSKPKVWGFYVRLIKD
jgi:uncharacterized protein (TIGR02145 family)